MFAFLNTQFFSPRGGLLTIFSASHRNKNAELHKIFTSLPVSEKLIDGESIRSCDNVGRSSYELDNIKLGC